MIKPGWTHVLTLVGGQKRVVYVTHLKSDGGAPYMVTGHYLVDPGLPSGAANPDGSYGFTVRNVGRWVAVCEGPHSNPGTLIASFKPGHTYRKGGSFIYIESVKDGETLHRPLNGPHEGIQMAFPQAYQNFHQWTEVCEGVPTDQMGVDEPPVLSVGDIRFGKRGGAKFEVLAVDGESAWVRRTDGGAKRHVTWTIKDLLNCTTPPETFFTEGGVYASNQADLRVRVITVGETFTGRQWAVAEGVTSGVPVLLELVHFANHTKVSA